MIFDDHDVTDDWNLTREWREAVATSPTGRRLVANALAAYWLFQGWGNDPNSDDEALARTVTAFLRADGTRVRGAVRGAAVVVRPLVVRRAHQSADRRARHAHAAQLRQQHAAPPGLSAPLSGGARRSWPAARGRSAAAIRRPLVLVSAVPVYGLELQERRQKFLADKVGPVRDRLRGLALEPPGAGRLHAHARRRAGTAMVSSAVRRRALRLQRAGRLLDRRSGLPLVQLVSSSFKHSGKVSRTALELLGRIVSRRHERSAGTGRPPIRRRLASRVLAKAANTDAWNGDAPVFLAPMLARALGIERPPDYRETRRYVAPAGDAAGSMLLGTNNVGQVTISDGEVTHRLFSRTPSGTRVPEATMQTGSQVLAALQRPRPGTGGPRTLRRKASRALRRPRADRVLRRLSRGVRSGPIPESSQRRPHTLGTATAMQTTPLGRKKSRWCRRPLPFARGTSARALPAHCRRAVWQCRRHAKGATQRARSRRMEGGTGGHAAPFHKMEHIRARPKRRGQLRSGGDDDLAESVALADVGVRYGYLVWSERAVDDGCRPRPQGTGPRAAQTARGRLTRRRIRHPSPCERVQRSLSRSRTCALRARPALTSTARSLSTR